MEAGTGYAQKQGRLRYLTRRMKNQYCMLHVWAPAASAAPEEEGSSSGRERRRRAEGWLGHSFCEPKTLTGSCAVDRRVCKSLREREKRPGYYSHRGLAATGSTGSPPVALARSGRAPAQQQHSSVDLLPGRISGPRSGQEASSKRCRPGELAAVEDQNSLLLRS